MEIACDSPGGSGINPLRQTVLPDAQMFAAPNLFLFGRHPFRVGMFPSPVSRRKRQRASGTSEGIGDRVSTLRVRAAARDVEGRGVGCKREEDVSYREKKLQVRRKRRKRLSARDRVPLPMPDGPKQRWSMDFVSDQLATGRRFRVLNILVDYCRECIGQIVDTSITGERVSRASRSRTRWSKASTASSGMPV